MLNLTLKPRQCYCNDHQENKQQIIYRIEKVPASPLHYIFYKESANSYYKPTKLQKGCYNDKCGTQLCQIKWQWKQTGNVNNHLPLCHFKSLNHRQHSYTCRFIFIIFSNRNGKGMGHLPNEQDKK